MLTKLPLLLFVMLIICINSATAQTGVDMADVMRSDGKIYVVVAVAAIVMIGILVYLVLLDRKIGAMEKKIKEKS
jgi:CcmD family protein